MAFNRLSAPDRASYRALVTSQREGQIVVDIVQYQPSERLADGNYVYGISLKKVHGRSAIFSLTRSAFNDIVDAAPFIKSKINQLESDYKQGATTLESSATAEFSNTASPENSTNTDNGNGEFLQFFAKQNLV